MLVEDCIRLYDIMKGMKCDIFHIYKDRIIGSEFNTITLSEVYCDTKIVGYVTKDDEVISSYEITKETMKSISERCKEQLNSNIDAENYIARYSIRGYKMSDLEDLDIRNMNISQNKVIPALRVDDLKQNEEFMQILAKKSSDGASLFRLNRFYILTIFSALLPINKSDKVALEIYNNQQTYTAKFIINKGKFTINKYINYFFI